MKALAALLLAIACAALPARADTPGVVSLLYAGSLVWPMSENIKPALAAQGIDVRGEAGGSTQLEGWIASGQRTPDVFISVDPALVAKLGDKVASSTTFATSELGMGWAGKSNYAYAFEAVGKGEMPLLVGAWRTAGPALPGAPIRPKIRKGQWTIDALDAADSSGRSNEKRRP